MKNILFIFKVRDELMSYLVRGLSSIKNLNLIFPVHENEEELLELAPEADLIVGWRPSPELLERATNLKIIINPGVGVQHHIKQYKELYKKRSITLINGHGNTYFTAQHAVALLLSLTNRIIQHHEWMALGLWRRGDEFAKSIPLRDRRIGLLGYGAVNQKVHRFLAGFDVEFFILKRSWIGNETLPTPAKKYMPHELESFLADIDILIIAVPQTDETDGMIGEKELGLFGPNGLIINIARGAVINEKALFEALSSGTIAGAAIDVWYDYQPNEDLEGKKFPFQHPFHRLENIVLSPHRGASSMDDLKRWDEVIENIKRFAEGNDNFVNVVDLDRGY
ncbi:MAG: NAD(P)-dependent oxidoreductase [Candidatus Odinarchaeota archaeon]